VREYRKYGILICRSGFAKIFYEENLKMSLEVRRSGIIQL